MRYSITGILFLSSGLLTGCNPSQPSSGSKTVPATSAFAVKSLTAERSGGHVHLTLVAHVKNPGREILLVSPPVVELLTGTREVPPFVAPGLAPAVVSPGGEADAVTHWWLAAEDLSGKLTLKVGEERAAVKSASAFALSSLPEKRAVALSFPDWKIP